MIDLAHFAIYNLKFQHTLCFALVDQKLLKGLHFQMKCRSKVKIIITKYLSNISMESTFTKLTFCNKILGYRDPKCKHEYLNSR